MKFETNRAKRQARVSHRKRMKRLDKAQKCADKKYPTHKLYEPKPIKIIDKSSTAYKIGRIINTLCLIWLFGLYLLMWAWLDVLLIIISRFFRNIFTDEFYEQSHSLNWLQAICEVLGERYRWFEKRINQIYYWVYK